MHLKHKYIVMRYIPAPLSLAMSVCLSLSLSLLPFLFGFFHDSVTFIVRGNVRIQILDDFPLLHFVRMLLRQV